MQVHSIHRQQ